MSDLPALVSGFRPVLPGYEGSLARWLAGYHREPRYFLSPTYLGAEPGVYSWGVVDGCLCLLKRRQFMNNPVMHLVVPPIHCDGDTVVELAVMHRWLGLGVGVKVSEDDVGHYGLPDDVGWDASQAEYLYRADDSVWPPGKAGKPIRKALHRANRELSMTPAGPADVEEAVALAKRWYQQLGRGRSAQRLVRRWFEGLVVPGVERKGVVVRHNGLVVGLVLSELIAPGVVVATSQHHDYQSFPPVNAGLLLHAAASRLWPGAVINKGGVGLGTPGLGVHKERLHPARVLRIGTLRPADPVTLEVFREAQPQQPE